jgi:hypothetical protein
VRDLNSLRPPLDSLAPADWAMYTDLLIDAGAPERRWRRALRITRSLQEEPRLVLVCYCEAVHLVRHPLRMGKNWFIPATRTMLTNYPLTWWPPARVRAGFRRYRPHPGQRRGQYASRTLLAGAFKTPFDCPPNVIRKHPWLVHRFFVRHGRRPETDPPAPGL